MSTRSASTETHELQRSIGIEAEDGTYAFVGLDPTERRTGASSFRGTSR